MRRRSQRHRKLLTAPRLSVQAHTSWPMRLLQYAIMLTILLACCGVAYLAGRLGNNEFRGITVQDVFKLRQDVGSLSRDNRLLLKRATQLEQDQRIDSDAGVRLQQQVGRLETENLSLRQQLGLFEEMLKRPDNHDPLRVSHFSAYPLADGRWHFQALLAQGNSSNPFDGYYQLKWGGSSSGNWPSDPQDSRSRLQFRHLTRIEGDLPAGVQPQDKLTLSLFAQGNTTPVAEWSTTLK